MKLLRGFQQVAALGLGSVATIGNFDGVHQGHQALLALLRKEATRLQLPMVVLLFEPQPVEYFQGQQAPARLFTLREKLQLLRQSGVDYVYCLKFDNQLASMQAIEFAERFIFSRLKVAYLLVGEDFRFGQGRVGDVALLARLGVQKSCVVQTFPDFFIDEQRVSSTKIRAALAKGCLLEAAKLLGRPYSLCGRVVMGSGLGRQWGIPTANLKRHHLNLPLTGVFCVGVKRLGKPMLKGVANIGCRPTINGGKNRLEIHLFDTNESLYGECLTIYFLHQLRDEIKFASVDLLIQQIHIDIAAAKEYSEKNTVVEMLRTLEDSSPKATPKGMDTIA